MSNRSEYLPDEAEQTPPAAGNGKHLRPEIFRRILRDPRIRPGAFRLWHLIFDMSRSKGFCWPGIRRIAAEIHVTDESITLWRRKLIDCGYLTAERITKSNAPQSKKLGGFLYRIPDLPGNAGQENPDGLFSTVKPGRDTPGGKDRTEKSRPDRRDVTDPRSNRVPPNPPEGDGSARSARINEGEERSVKGKPRMTRRFAEKRLAEIETELKTVKSQDANYAKRLHPETARTIAFFEKRAAETEGQDEAKARSYLEEAERRRVNPASYIRGEMMPGAKHLLDTKREEQNKLKAWLAGNRGD